MRSCRGSSRGRDQLAGLPVAAEVKAWLPAEACTVHRLLGHRPGRVSFPHEHEHPLPYNLVVVDEASMLDLALATKLVQALSEDGRLILLGDKTSSPTAAVVAQSALQALWSALG